jgi:hypothetical protein
MAGPSDNQPINPNLADAVNKMASATEALSNAATKIENSLDAAADSASHLLKNLDMTKLADLVSIFDSVEESTKEIAAYARKMRTGIFNTKNSADAVKYAHQIVAAQKEMLKKTKENTLAWQAGSKSIEKMNGFIEKMSKRVGEMNQDELREFGRLMYEAEQSADKLFKRFKDAKLGQIGRAMRGIESVVAPGAFAKGTAKRDKHLARQSEIQEQSRTRLAIGRASADDRRAKALSEMKKTPAMLDKAGNVNLGDAGVRQTLAAKMGYRGKRASTFVAGEGAMAAGAASGGEKYEKLMAHGGGGVGGGLSELASVVEGLGAGIEGAMAAFAPEIEILVLVIGALVEAFEGFTKQNKQMEGALGKGGLFTQGGDAFAAARSALNPRGGGYTQLGGTFERNLAIGQAMTQGGRGVGELVNGGPETANMGPGAKGEFMQGPIGQVQRIAMGVGRIAGLTDVESVEQVLKNLDQYGQTIEASEKFFVQVNKDTKAAGISTTKYLQIIDEVSSHFDRMNKSLGETMGFLRELGRTGAIGTESLKDLTAFLAGGPKADVGNVAQRGFLEMNMRGGLARARVAGEKENISGTVTNNLLPALQNIFPQGQIPPELANIGNMSEKDAQQLISSLRDKVAHAVDASGNPIAQTTKAAATEALTSLSNSIQKLGAYSRGGGLNRAGAIGMTGEDMVGTTTQQLNRMEQMSKRTGIPMSALVSGDFSKVSGERLIMAQQLASQVMGVDNPQQAQSAMRGLGQTMGQNRLDEAVSNKRSAVALVRELGSGSSKLWKLWASDHKINATQLNLEEHAQEFLRDNHDQLVTQTGALDTTRDWFVKHASRIPGITNQEQAQALQDARRIGRQTQGVEDAIKNALHIWMTKLVSGVEFIVDHWAWGGGEGDRQKLQDRFNQGVGQTESMQGLLEKAMGKNRADAKDADADQKDQLDDQYRKMEEVERHLSEMKDQNTFMSKEQADQADADKKFVMGLGTGAPSMNGSKTAAAGTMYGQYFASDTKGIKQPVGMMDLDSLLKAINTSTTNSRTTQTNYFGNANTHLTPQQSPSSSNEKATNSATGQ